METSVNNKCKTFTSLEQSKKLAEILPHESADMYYMNGTKHVLVIPNYETDFFHLKEDDVPCWSLSALLSVLPYPDIKQYDGSWGCRVENKDIAYLWVDSNPIDACVAMIEKLHEQNIL